MKMPEPNVFGRLNQGIVVLMSNRSPHSVLATFIEAAFVEAHVRMSAYIVQILLNQPGERKGVGYIVERESSNARNDGRDQYGAPGSRSGFPQPRSSLRFHSGSSMKL